MHDSFPKVPLIFVMERLLTHQLSFMILTILWDAFLTQWISALYLSKVDAQRSVLLSRTSVTLVIESFRLDIFLCVFSLIQFKLWFSAWRLMTCNCNSWSCCLDLDSFTFVLHNYICSLCLTLVEGCVSFTEAASSDLTRKWWGNEAFDAATLPHAQLPPLFFLDNDQLVLYFLSFFAGRICKKGRQNLRRAPITREKGEKAVKQNIARAPITRENRAKVGF